MGIDWVAVGSVATAIGVAVAAGSVLYAARQLRTSKRVSAGDFLLRLDDQMAKHSDVHMKLRPGGMWADRKTGPKTTEDWTAVEGYMGLFERIRVLVEAGVLDLNAVNRFYGYRISNIVANPVIRTEKLEKRANDWQDFIWLERALEARR